MAYCRCSGWCTTSKLNGTSWLGFAWCCLVCDNQAMVNRSNEQRDVLTATPNSTMDTEWDVLAEIWNTRTKLQAQHTIEWIKGHQDKHKPYVALPLKAQLNVDSDALAVLAVFL